MLNFIGTYECKLDNKGRLAIPIAYKKQLETVINEPFIIKRSIFQSCLEIIPHSEWSSIMQKINTLNRFVKKNNDFIRMFTAGVKVVEMDGSGRLQISKDLIEFAHLEKEIVLSSSVGMIEVWDKTRYEKVIDPTNVDFALLAEEVMGNNEDGNNVS